MKKCKTCNQELELCFTCGQAKIECVCHPCKEIDLEDSEREKIEELLDKEQIWPVNFIKNVRTPRGYILLTLTGEIYELIEIEDNKVNLCEGFYMAEIDALMRKWNKLLFKYKHEKDEHK